MWKIQSNNEGSSEIFVFKEYSVSQRDQIGLISQLNYRSRICLKEIKSVSEKTRLLIETEVAIWLKREQVCIASN